MRVEVKVKVKVRFTSAGEQPISSLRNSVEGMIRCVSDRVRRLGLSLSSRATSFLLNPIS